MSIRGVEPRSPTWKVGIMKPLDQMPPLFSFSPIRVEYEGVERRAMRWF
jgi:hypothetical protein